jgi:hypothetical protein
MLEPGCGRRRVGPSRSRGDRTHGTGTEFPTPIKASTTTTKHPAIESRVGSVHLWLVSVIYNWHLWHRNHRWRLQSFRTASRMLPLPHFEEALPCFRILDVRTLPSSAGPSNVGSSCVRGKRVRPTRAACVRRLRAGSRTGPAPCCRGSSPTGSSAVRCGCAWPDSRPRACVPSHRGSDGPRRSRCRLIATRRGGRHRRPGAAGFARC